MVAEALQTNTTLTSLDLSFNDIGAEGAGKVAEALQTNKTLTSLYLRGNGIGDEGASMLLAALQTNKTLTSLDLSCNNIGAKGAEKVAEALKTNTTLTSLNLYRNGIGDEGARMVAEALKTNKTLTSLDLRVNDIGAEGAGKVAEALKTNKTLTSLDLRDNRIGAKGAGMVAEALQTNKTLTSLDLRENGIGAEGAGMVAEALQTNKTLTSLDLSWNDIGDEGARMVAEALQTNKTLTSLDLALNYIGAEGARMVAEALKTNKTLTSLYLSLNDIGDEGASMLLAALQTDKTLTSLDLARNGIGDEGAGKVAEALQTNTTLTSLNLRDNRIGAKGARMVAEALQTNKTLTSLDLYSYNIGAEGARMVAEALQTNTTLTSLQSRDRRDPCGYLSRNAMVAPILSVPKSSENGHEGAVLRRLEKNADIAARDNDGEAPRASETNAPLLCAPGRSCLDGDDVTICEPSDTYIPNTSETRKAEQVASTILTKELELEEFSSSSMKARAVEEGDEGYERVDPNVSAGQRDASKYSPEEDRAIQIGVEKFGVGRWADILKNTPELSRRSRDSIRNRWGKLAGKNVQNPRSLEGETRQLESETRQIVSSRSGDQSPRQQHVRTDDENGVSQRQHKRLKVGSDDVRSNPAVDPTRSSAETIPCGYPTASPLESEGSPVLPRPRSGAPHDDDNGQKMRRDEVQGAKDTVDDNSAGGANDGKAAYVEGGCCRLMPQAPILSARETEAEKEGSRDEPVRPEGEGPRKKPRVGVEPIPEPVAASMSSAGGAPQGEASGSQDDPVALARGLLASVLACHEAAAIVLPLPYLRECTAEFDATRQLGEGAFGQVFEAVDAVSGVTFAVKRLDRAFLAPHADPTARAAQLRAAAREVEVLSRFRHPHIVRLLGYSFAADGDRCLVYPLLAGGALDAALRDEARAAALTWRVRLRIAAGLAKALNYLHRGGSGATCYHRDVKAANVCLTAELSPQLIDCGLAKYVPNDAPAATSTGGRFGTPGYQCPRYGNNGKFDSKSEAYSLGIVLVELLVGEVQNERRSFYEVFVEEEEEELSKNLDSRAGDWPMEMVAGLVEVILACLAKYMNRCDTHEAMQQLMMLERTHCQQTAEEAQLQAVRAELEKLRREAPVGAVQPREQQHTCLVCFDDFPLKEGVKCAAAVDGHFMCKDCLKGYVRDATSDGNLCRLEVDRRWQGIPCPGVNCKAPRFTERALAVQLSDDAFALLAAARDRIVERRTIEEVEANVRAQLQASNVRNHIVECILNLACPHCKQVFNDSDFDCKHNCCALSCGRCSTGFCAFCLKDCGMIPKPHLGDAAHRHVLECEHNNTGALFYTKKEFEAAQQERRRRELRLYLDTLSTEDKERARHDCDSVLRAHDLV